MIPTPTDTIEAMPRARRPHELLLHVHHQLLYARGHLTAAANAANAFGAQPRVRATVEAIDRLRAELFALAVEAEAWRQRQAAAKAERAAAWTDGNT